MTFDTLPETPFFQAETKFGRLRALAQVWVRVARLTDDEMADLTESGLVFAEENADEGATDVLVMVE